ncbi:MAG: hypothetical protein D6811_01445 [Alphaproteobacteria bacterium]|nr:MAG: hypothetical protein D6811_01445 [Alphaproteobacteria bacterium]
MTKKLIALVTAAGISLAAMAPAVQAQDEMGMGFNMLTGAIYNELSQRGLPTDGIRELSLSKISQIKAILDSGDLSEGDKNNRILAILRS